MTSNEAKKFGSPLEKAAYVRQVRREYEEAERSEERVRLAQLLSSLDNCRGTAIA